jgi:hypothetical protein
MADLSITRFPNGISESADEGAWNAELALLNPTRYASIFDDFMLSATSATSDVTAWTKAGGAGTPVYQDAAGGVFNTVTAAVDNDYQAFSSPYENFLFAAGKKLWLEARVKLSEATVLESTWWVGLTDTLTTGGMQANAAGPLASYDGALFYKTPETSMTLNFETSNAAAQVTTADIATTVTNTWTKVAFFFDGTSTVTPYWAVNGATAWTKGTPHSIALAGLEEMHLVWGVKAGPTGAAETLQIDYIMCVQER